jgi:hypothetical protein
MLKTARLRMLRGCLRRVGVAAPTRSGMDEHQLAGDVAELLADE